MKFQAYEKMIAHFEKISNIDNFIADGFEKVCDVRGRGHWHYHNINEDLLFSDHRSWVYLIVLNKMIVKIGESGNPLGIKAWAGNQVTTLKGSKSRLGRLCNGDGTDNEIRRKLNVYIEEGHSVTIWAKRCPIEFAYLTIAGKAVSVKYTIHKDLEQAILEYFKKETGQLPLLNKARK